MKSEISIAVLKYPGGKVKARVRKAIYNGNKKLLSKYGLSETGRWIEVKPGEMWPDECYLDARIGDVFIEKKRVK